MDNEQWEREAAGILRDLNELQQTAPLDVAGYLQDAENHVEYGLRRYRENRQGESDDE